MDWANERFVRNYTRDTPEWIALGWHAQSLFMHLKRKVDRSGVLSLGNLGVLAVPVVMGAVEIWDRLAPAFDKLVAYDWVRIVDDKLIIPRFVESEEAPQSDRQRQAELRARRRDAALHGGASRNVTSGNGAPPANGAPAPSTPDHTSMQPVTKRDGAITNRDAEVTNRDLGVTGGHAASRGVTPSFLPSLPEIHAASGPAPAAPFFAQADKSSSSGGAPDAHAPPLLSIVEPKKAKSTNGHGGRAKPEAASWLEWFNRRFGRHFELRDEVVKQVGALLAKGFSQDDMRLVALAKRALWEDDPKMREYLVPASILRLDKFGSYLDQAHEMLREQPEEKRHG